MKPECKQCKFFAKDGWKGKYSSNDDKSECRLHAPTILSGSGTGWSDQLFPFVEDFHWCGEFEPKAGDE